MPRTKFLPLKTGRNRLNKRKRVFLVISFVVKPLFSQLNNDRCDAPSRVNSFQRGNIFAGFRLDILKKIPNLSLFKSSVDRPLLQKKINKVITHKIKWDYCSELLKIIELRRIPSREVWGFTGAICDICSFSITLFPLPEIRDIDHSLLQAFKHGGETITKKCMG